jgi:hypothetical protein
MKDHEASLALVPLAAAGALAGDELVAVEQHALVCPECARRLEVLRLYAGAARTAAAGSARRVVAEDEGAIDGGRGSSGGRALECPAAYLALCVVLDQWNSRLDACTPRYRRRLESARRRPCGRFYLVLAIGPVDLDDRGCDGRGRWETQPIPEERNMSRFQEELTVIPRSAWAIAAVCYAGFAALAWWILIPQDPNLAPWPWWGRAAFTGGIPLFGAI